MQESRARRHVRVFISSTFLDMQDDRNALMTHAWPELRAFCRQRGVEFTEVDLRWGISEEQSRRNETLKLCLDEIQQCRPFFIGLLGERYGWVPGELAFTDDLTEEQPWLTSLDRKSVTELEILHGVLNNPDMVRRAYFYFRDPAYARERGDDFLPADTGAADAQTSLKNTIRDASERGAVRLREGYTNPGELVEQVLADLREAIDAEFPAEDVPDTLTQESLAHEAYAESRRRTYIERDSYYEDLDAHAVSPGVPLVLVGDSGFGKSALIANWVARWRTRHPGDLVIEHYIGGTDGSADCSRIIRRVISEVARWVGQDVEIPESRDELLRVFSESLGAAERHARLRGLRCVLALDALNMLEDRDGARNLGWLPSGRFAGRVRLLASTLAGETLEAVELRAWNTLRIAELSAAERTEMVSRYLARFGKTLDESRTSRLAAAAPSGNPLYLKILLDELRVTGTHGSLDVTLDRYLAAPDVPTLLREILARYEHDYEDDRPGLVGDALGLLWAARRGLSEPELLRALRPGDLPHLPAATWSPLRAALQESLVERSGILCFAHDFLRAAVEQSFVAGIQGARDLRLTLADDFEQQGVDDRSCEELPWLVCQAGERERLRATLLDIPRFLRIFDRDRHELHRYWVWLGAEREVGCEYRQAFDEWEGATPGHGVQIEQGFSFDLKGLLVGKVVSSLGKFLSDAGEHSDAEFFWRRALCEDEQLYGPEHPTVAVDLSNLAACLGDTGQYDEAERLFRRALGLLRGCFGGDSSETLSTLESLGTLLRIRGRTDEAAVLLTLACAIAEETYGERHPEAAACLSRLATVDRERGRWDEAETLLRRAIQIKEEHLGRSHPGLGDDLHNLGELLWKTGRLGAAREVATRVLEIDEGVYGFSNERVALDLNLMGEILSAQGSLGEAEEAMRRSVGILTDVLGEGHPETALALSNLGWLLKETGRLDEAESAMRRSIEADIASYGLRHPAVALKKRNLALLLLDLDRTDEAETLAREALGIDREHRGPAHISVGEDLSALAAILSVDGRSQEALGLLQQALEIKTASLGERHPAVIDDLRTLASLFYGARLFDEAESVARRVLAATQEPWQEGASGPECPEVGRATDRDVLRDHSGGEMDERYQALIAELMSELSKSPARGVFAHSKREELSQLAKGMWDAEPARVDAQVIHVWLRGRLEEDPQAERLTDEDAELIKAVALSVMGLSASDKEKRVQYLQQALMTVREIRGVPGAEILSMRLSHTLGPMGMLP